MTSLADIWDTPAETASRSDPVPIPVNNNDDDVLANNPKRSTARARSTKLFLDSDSENEGQTSNGARYASKPGSSKADIDAFWDDLDEDPETTFKQLAPSLDVDVLKRQADAQIALIPHQILPSSSPPRDTGDGKEGGKDKAGKKGKEVTTRKKRPVLDEGRLVGSDGFPALIKQAKHFKPRGKGHELSDLNRLLNVYQFWGHNMYPRTQFIDTVQRVERLCHTKRLHVALSVWRDEDKGLINGHKIPIPDDPDRSDSDNDNDNDDDVARPSDIPVATEDERSSPAPSRHPSLPPSSASEAGALEDDFDIDAMIAEEEAARAQEATSGPGPLRMSASRGPSGPTDEDDAMWDEMRVDPPDEPWVPPDREAVAPRPTKPAVDRDWNGHGDGDGDGDEDMWDAVGDLEATATAAKTPAAAVEDAQRGSSPVTGTGGMVGLDPTRLASNDDGWDEMYAD